MKLLPSPVVVEIHVLIRGIDRIVERIPANTFTAIAVGTAGVARAMIKYKTLDVFWDIAPD